MKLNYRSLLGQYIEQVNRTNADLKYGFVVHSEKEKYF